MIFIKETKKSGTFSVTEDTVRSVEDLEKLFFVWQEAVEVADDARKITVGQDLESKEGCRFSALTIKE